MNLTKTRYSSSYILVCACLVLGWLAVQSYNSQIELSGQSQPVTTSPGTQKLSPVTAQLRLDPPRQNDFEAVVSRPLFNESRRPPEPLLLPEELKPLPVAVKPPAVTLNGVILTQNERIAVFEDRASSRTIRLREGDKLGQWHVERLESDRVILRYGERTYEIMLRSYKKGPPDLRLLDLPGLPDSNKLGLPPTFKPN